MRKVLILVCSLLVVRGQAFAQYENMILTKELITEDDFIARYKESLIPPTQRKANSLESRMVAISKYKYDISAGQYMFFDSSFYKYSGAHIGGRSGFIEYDSMYYCRWINGAPKITGYNYTLYDNLNLPERVVFRSWDPVSMSGSITSYRSIVHNASHQWIADTSYHLDATGLAFTPSYANNMTYNGDGQLLHLVRYDYINVGNMPEYEENYTYDANGRLTDLLFERWLAVPGNHSKDHNHYIYNSNDVCIGVTVESYDFNTLTWQKSGGVAYGYDISGNWTRQAKYNIISGHIDTTEIAIRSYDNSRNLTEVIFQVIYPGKVAENFAHEIYNYNASNQCSMFKTETWDKNTNTYAPTSYDRQEFYYYEVFDPNSVVQTEQPNKALTIYPNPAVDKVHISHAGIGTLLHLHDITGRTLHIQTVNSDYETLDLSAYPTGSYIIELTDVNGGRVVKKISKG